MGSCRVEISALHNSGRHVEATLVVPLSAGATPDKVMGVFRDAARWATSDWIGVEFLVFLGDSDREVFGVSTRSKDMRDVLGLVEYAAVTGHPTLQIQL